MDDIHKSQVEYLAALKEHEIILSHCEKLEDRVGKLEDRYDILYDMTASLKILTNSVKTLDTSVDNLRTDFKNDMDDVKAKQNIYEQKLSAIQQAPALKDHKVAESIRGDFIKIVSTGVIIYLLTQLLPNIQW